MACSSPYLYRTNSSSLRYQLSSLSSHTSRNCSMPEVSYLLHLHDENDNEDDAPEVAIPNLHSAPLCYSGYDGLDPYFPDSEFATVDLSVPSHLQSVLGRNSGFIPMLEDYPGTSPNVDLLDRQNQVNFVIDLFHQRVEQSTIVFANLPSLGLNLDTTLHEFERNYDEMGFSNLELELGLELMIFADRNENRNSPVMTVNTECSMGSGIPDLRVVGDESDSDDSENEVVGVDENAEEDEFGLDSDGDDTGNLLLHWNSFELDDHSHANEDFDWEEMVDREVLSLLFNPDLDEDLDTFVHGMIVLPSHQNMRNSEWEVLSNIPNSEFNTNPEHYDEFPADDYELLFGQFSENENAAMGKPPASRIVVENLPSLILTQNDLVDKHSILCAVCKDEIIVYGEAKQLPCNHRYHSDCIIPWLGIRNTCPVCRHELPTDDVDYERGKTRRIGNFH